MQICTVLVSLAGDTGNIVPKSGVTVPEFLVLMASHGQHSVTPVANSVDEMRGEPHSVELARLVRVYGAEPVEACFGKPTFSTKLPTRFSEVGITIPGDEDGPKDDKDKETPTAKKKRLAAEKAHAELLAEAKQPLGIGGAFGAATAEELAEQAEQEAADKEAADNLRLDD